MAASAAAASGSMGEKQEEKRIDERGGGRGDKSGVTPPSSVQTDPNTRNHVKPRDELWSMENGRGSDSPTPSDTGTSDADIRFFRRIVEGGDSDNDNNHHTNGALLHQEVIANHLEVHFTDEAALVAVKRAAFGGRAPVVTGPQRGVQLERLPTVAAEHMHLPSTFDVYRLRPSIAGLYQVRTVRVRRWLGRSVGRTVDWLEVGREAGRCMACAYHMVGGWVVRCAGRLVVLGGWRVFATLRLDTHAQLSPLFLSRNLSLIHI